MKILWIVVPKWIIQLASDSATISISFFSTYQNAIMGLDYSAYYKILNAHEWSPLSYKEIADSLMKNGVKQMYHAIVNENGIGEGAKLFFWGRLSF